MGPHEFGHQRIKTPHQLARRAFILPQHRDTYRVTPQNRYWTNGYASEVKLRLAKPLQQRFHILKQGDKLVIRDAPRSR